MDKKEAIKILKDFHDKSALFSVRTALETLHPELKESEDEKIRKALIEYFNEQCDMSDWNGVYGYQVVAWLEKQANHANFRNKIQIGDKVTRNKDGVLVNLSQLNRVAKKDENQGESYTKKDVDNAYVEGMAFAKVEFEKQGEQKSVGEEIVEALRTEYEKGRADAFAQMQKEWSEEDEVKINRIVACLENLNVADNDILLKDVDWLKSLKDRVKSQNTWKPSDGQMSALKIATHCPDLGLSRVLKTLYNDLDKLTKE